MSKYKRRVIMASMAIHGFAIVGFFAYWILTPDLEIPKKNKHKMAKNDFVEGNESNAPNSYENEEETDTGKDPNEDYANGDLSDKEIRDLIDNEKYKNMTAEEKAEQLNQKFNALATTPVKSVEGASNTVLDAFGVKEKKSKKPMTQRFSQKNGGKIDIDSLRLYDYEIVDGKYALIYKDKNNIYIKNDPVALSELDDYDRQKLNLIKKAKENKKFRILLEASESLIRNFE